MVRKPEVRTSAENERIPIFETISCDFCGAREFNLVFEARDTNYFFDGVFRIVQCPACGLVFLNPRPDAASIHLFYPNENYTCFKQQEDDRARLGEEHPLMQIVRRSGINVGAMCDVGCSTGNFLVAAKNAGWDVAGVEPNDYARHVCQQRIGEKNVASNLEGANYPSNHFQVVTLWHVLEHLPNPHRALQEINRILAPGGV